MKPTIGRIVIIREYWDGSPLRQPRPAIITQVHSDTCVDVVGFDATKSETGTFSVTSAGLDEGNIVSGWGWSWPPRG